MAKTPEEIKAELERTEFTKKNQKAITEQNKVNKEQKEILEQIKEQLQSQSTQSVKDLKKVLESQTNKKGKDRFSEKEREDLTSSFGLQQLGLNQTDAANRIAANRQLEDLTKEKERLEELQKTFGLDDVNSTELQALENDIAQLEEIKKFGRTLGDFEKGFRFFSEKKFDQLREDIKEGGRLTNQGIAKSFGENLKGDFDRVLSFFGPAVGFLQQIPFLGTIASLLKDYTVKFFAEVFLSRRADKANTKKLLQSDKKTQQILKNDFRGDQREREMDARRFMKGSEGFQTGMGGFGDVNITDESGGGLGLVAPLAGMGFATGAGGAAAGAGLTGLVSTIAGLPAGAFAVKLLMIAGGIAGAIAVLGAGVALGAYATMKGIGEGVAALEETGFSENMKKLSSKDIDYKHVGDGMGELFQASMWGSLAGLVDLLPGNSDDIMSRLGKDLAGFAEHMDGSKFAELDAQKIADNAKLLFAADDDESWWQVTIGKSTSLADLGKDIKTFTDGSKDFIGMDVATLIKNMDDLKVAFKGFEWGEAAETSLWFGLGDTVIDNIQDVANITFKDDKLGEKMISLGEGLASVNDGIKGLESDAVGNLGKIAKELRKFEEVNINFGTIPSTAGTGANLNYNGSQFNQAPIMVNTLNSAMNQQNKGPNYQIASGVIPNASSAHNHSILN